ncbi:MAG: DedA family protein [Halobacteriovoraceae bacterium]|jgi:membrane protein YqaA with SNARE-associated domain|nr:DedA family protein [Halobacteriovoraceae bacterium]MBT5095365.1 DedA family protein [Halobacteriovoraceae bacterium]
MNGAIGELPSKNALNRLYDKVLESCDSKYAPYILALVSFTESCCFIIPPEVMMLPMGIANRKKIFFWTGIATVFSVLGAIAGYYLGAYFWQSIQPFMFEYIPGFAHNFEKVGEMYRENAVSALFIAAFTPIPYKVFTVVAGVYSAKIGLLTLIGTAIVGRGTRYFIIAGVIYILGPKAKEFIEKHFVKFTWAVGLVIVLAAVVIKLR